MRYTFNNCFSKFTNYTFIVIIIFVFNACSEQAVVEEIPSEEAITVVTDTIIPTPPDSLFWYLDKLIEDSSLRHASQSYIIYNISQDTLIAAYDEFKSLVPASTLKIITSAAALEIFGGNKRFVTSIAYEGEIVDSILEGHIYIIGGGDPALGSTVYGKHDFISDWAKAIKDLKVDSINGSIIADPRIFSINAVPYTWIWGELGFGYAAPAHGITAYDNVFSFNLPKNKKGFFIPQRESMQPYIPELLFQSSFHLTTDEKSSLQTLMHPQKQHTIITGGFPDVLDETLVRTTIHDPAYLLAFQLNEKLKEKNINTAGPPINIIYNDSLKPDRQALKTITRTYSPTLLSIINNVNTQSNNLFSEHLLKHLGIHSFGFGDTETGTKAVINFWRNKGLDINGMFLFDGSGLSRFNAITSKQLLDVLFYMYQSENFVSFFNSLAQAGNTGTLRNFCADTPAQGYVYAKSGTMSRIKSYAGYVATVNNDTLAFAFVVNNFTCTSREMTKKYEEIMVRMRLFEASITNIEKQEISFTKNQ